MLLRLLIQFAPMLLMLFIAAIIDLKSRKIPNWLNAAILISGIFQSLFWFRTVTPLQSVEGVLLAFVLTFGLFVINAIGGADVKILAAMGAWVGPFNIFLVIITKDVVGLVIVLIQAIAQRRVKELFRNSASVAFNLLHVRQLGLETVQKMGLSNQSVRKPLPMAVPILISVLLLLILGTGAQ